MWNTKTFFETQIFETDSETFLDTKFFWDRYWDFFETKFVKIDTDTLKK